MTRKIGPDDSRTGQTANPDRFTYSQ
jgi:hypothetical protein